MQYKKHIGWRESTAMESVAKNKLKIVGIEGEIVILMD